MTFPKRYSRNKPLKHKDAGERWTLKYHAAFARSSSRDRESFIFFLYFYFSSFFRFFFMLDPAAKRCHVTRYFIAHALKDFIAKTTVAIFE